MKIIRVGTNCPTIRSSGRPVSDAGLALQTSLDLQLMSLIQYLKYADSTQFPTKSHPATSDYFHTLGNQIIQLDRPKSLVGIVGVYPRREPDRPIESLSFFAFSGSRTAYAALTELEDVFADFYLLTGVLPYINPLSKGYFAKPKELSQYLLNVFSRNGALIYGPKE